jgi:hypothetical protein
VPDLRRRQFITLLGSVAAGRACAAAGLPVIGFLIPKIVRHLSTH